MDAPRTPYPVSLTIEYPEYPRNRLTVFFRIFAAIPIGIILALLIGTGWNSEETRRGFEYATAGFAVAPTLLLILFRQKYPRWWFDWNLNLNRFLFRVSAYLGLLRDEYPSTDAEQAVRLDVVYPDAKVELNRWLVLVKWFLVIPHIIVLAFVDIAAYVCVIIAWFAILFTGRYPRPLFDFVVGVMRWQARVVISAVDLIMGLGVYAGLDVIKVPGATGLIDTNYEGKADACLSALTDHDFVFVHVEASDEAGHARDLKQKVLAIEYLDSRLVARVMKGIEEKGIETTVAVLPDHLTPVAKGNHVHGPVPVAILNPRLPADSVQTYDEVTCASGVLGLLRGDRFIRTVLGR